MSRGIVVTVKRIGSRWIVISVCLACGLYVFYPTAFASTDAGLAIGSKHAWRDPDILGYPTEVIQQIVTTLGIIIGGVWGYFHFHRGRTYVPRLVLTVSHSVTKANGRLYLTAKITVKNVGLSKVFVNHMGTTCIVQFLPPSTKRNGARLVSKWIPFTVTRIFENVRILEAGVAIVEHVLLEVPSDGAKVWKILARVVTSKRKGSAECISSSIAVLGREHYEIARPLEGSKNE